MLRSLATLEPRWNFSVLLLTLMTSSRRLSLARRRTTTTSYALAVGFRLVLQVRQDRGVPRLEKGDEECRDDAIRILRRAQGRREGG